MLEKQGLAVQTCKHLHLDKIEPKNEAWEKMIEQIRNINKEVKIALVGKYMLLQDSYLSVAESLRHGGFASSAKVDIGFIDSETITKENVAEVLKEYDGILVPGGFGSRGIEGKICAIEYARTNNIPFLGICLGMQMAVVEFARNVLGLADANSAEFDENTKNPVIHIMETQKGVTKKGGTMRLGAYPCKIKQGTLAYKIYGEENISERHRHRFEYNNDYKEKLESAGLICSGTSPDGTLVEIVENVNHPFFIAGQFHPEFKSRPDRPAPLFKAFVEAALKYKEN
jgi:CTP synthase